MIFPQIEIEIIKTHLGFLEVDRSKHIFTRLAYTHTHTQIHARTHMRCICGGDGVEGREGNYSIVWARCTYG